MTDREFLKMRQAELEGKKESTVAYVKLPSGVQLKTVGKRDFSDNTMDSQTGTIAVRYIFDNKNGLLVSGGYVDVLIGEQSVPTGLKVPQRAVLTNETGDYVLTVVDGKAVATAVKLGETIGTEMVVLSGLKANDVVIVDGVQKARAGVMVNATIEETK